ncbi:Caleosin related protein-domain-containing protein, partial [Jimgerdemannia flammicorona]
MPTSTALIYSSCTSSYLRHQATTVNMSTKIGEVTYIKTSAARAPVTSKRPVPTDLEQYIDHPAIPRASEAVSKEMPNGTKNYEAIKDERTVLQQHVSFFDRDHDGIITPWDTLVGFNDLGFNLIFSLAAMVVIHLSFSWVTQDFWFPNPFFWIYAKNMHRAKHGSDSETYDPEGRFVPEKFEQIFSKFARRDANGQTMTFWELLDFIKGQRNVADPFGCLHAHEDRLAINGAPPNRFAMYFEWLTTYLLIGHNGKIYKEDIRGVFDSIFLRRHQGSLFYDVRDKRQRQKQPTKHNFIEAGKRMGGEIKRRAEQIGEQVGEEFRQERVKSE